MTEVTAVLQAILLVVFVVYIIALVRLIKEKGYGWSAIAIALLAWLINASAWLTFLLQAKIPDFSLTPTQILVANLWSNALYVHAAVAMGTGLYYWCMRKNGNGEHRCDRN